MSRISENECFLQIAKIMSKRSTCKRRCYGSVIVKYPHGSKRAKIVSVSYNGSPAGTPNCSDNPEDCIRKKNNIAHNTDYTFCSSVHSEINACLQAGERLDPSCVLYLYGFDLETNEEVKNPTPCKNCIAAMLNVGISKYINNAGEHFLQKNIGIYSGGCG